MFMVLMIVFYLTIFFNNFFYLDKTQMIFI